VSKQLLFVDDELVRNVYYIETLRERHIEVRAVGDVDSALLEFKKGLTYDCVVLDVMMPPGNAFADADTDDGIETGVLLSEAIRNQDAEIEIVVLTNVSESSVLQKLKAIPRLTVLRKLEFPPDEAADEICKVLERGNPA
jgi:CheY-like chemotaxis protein